MTLGSPIEKTPIIPPSAWVMRHLALIRPAGRVLDLACGGGRHARMLAARGFEVLAVDRDATALAALNDCPGVRTRLMDLEGDTWPLGGEHFDAVIVTNYLWRPRMNEVLALPGRGGLLIYETFMVGNEAYGKPSNPDFLLRSNELREIAAAAGMREVAFEQGYCETPKPAMRQAICAVRD